MPAKIKIKETLIYSAATPANIPLIGKAEKANIRVELITLPNKADGTISCLRVNQLIANNVTEPT